MKYVAALMLLLLPAAQAYEGQSRVAVIDPGLDLWIQVRDHVGETGPPPVPLGPRLVAGEGAAPENHTFVRVLDAYGLCEHQFLAFPPDVRGGVQVNAGEVFAGETNIVATALDGAANREVRVFREDGILRSAFTPAEAITAPYTVAVGDFAPGNPGDEIAVASATQGNASRVLGLYDGNGTLLGMLDLPLAYPGYDEALALSPLHIGEELPDLVLMSFATTQRAFMVDAALGWTYPAELGAYPDGVAAHESAFENQMLVAGGDEDLLSTLFVVDDTLSYDPLDVGYRENCFWVHPIPEATPVYTFDSDLDGWTAGPNGGAVMWADGAMVLTYENDTPFDPYINGPVVSFNGDARQELAMEINVVGAPGGSITGGIYFMPAAGGHGLAPFSATNGRQVIRMNLADAALGSAQPYTGAISYIRLDFPDGSGSYATYQNARVEVDWIAVTDDPNFVPGDTGPGFGTWVRKGQFRHLRTDAASPAYHDDDFDNEDPDHWTGGTFDDYIESTQRDYFTGLPSMWEPTFTHRQFQGAWDAWADAIDAQTGLPRFAAITRLNNRADYSEIGGSFLVMSYAPDIGPTERLMVWPLRKYLRALAEKFRVDPEQMAGLEPNHEMEIELAADNSAGDYHPNMIAGFYQHLRRLYTTDAKIRQRFGLSYTSQADFDAPRNQGRGAWDSYALDNPFHVAWVEYARRVVLWRIAEGMRESLLAGFPPEVIKTHQIPANYAVGSPWVNHRITPIDWVLSCGTGYGGTRYGVWYNRTNQWINDAFTSGHNMVSIGEYHPLTTSQSAATAQMDYLFEHGVNFIHHMNWNTPAYDIPGRAAYMDLAANDRPRPGTAGGVGQVRAVVQPDGEGGETRYNIACIGTGLHRTGLLKSLTAEGAWEGSVYVSPFHAHLTVESVTELASMTLAANQYDSGGVTGLNSGDRIVVEGLVRSDDPAARFTLLALHDGIELGGHRQIFSVTGDWTHARYVLRIQNPMDPVQILISSGERDGATGGAQTIEFADFSVRVIRESIARVEYDDPVGMPHRGGVTFDVLSRDYVPADATPSPFDYANAHHHADVNTDSLIDSTELLRVIQLYNAGAYACDASTEDGYAPHAGGTACGPHHADFAEPRWQLSLTELLRVIQLHAALGGYTSCPGAGTDDGFCLAE